MAIDILSYPPPTHDFRPERKAPKSTALDSFLRGISGAFVRPLRSQLHGMKAIVPLVAHYGAGLDRQTDAALRAEAARLGLRLRREGFQKDLTAQTFALVREAAVRTIGMRHFDCQLIGGWAMLKGMVAEMETGEGKTLTATLAACTAALAGLPVHIISVNDYLVNRDAAWMGPVYEALGLTVGCITHDVPPQDRRSVYACDITYCANKEVVFDYLRDRIALKGHMEPLRLQAEYLYGNTARVRQLVLRGLHFAIVDEADSVLIDEARTPLIISGKTRGEAAHFMAGAMAIAEELQSGIDYRIDYDARKIELTDRGKHQVRERAVPMGPEWKGRIRREGILRQALTAQHLFHRDEHYLVRDGKVEIIDEFTGRVMPDRSWERGLHQLIELKEGCEVSMEHETIARISYQRFFRRYLRLAGMTGTAHEVAGELWRVYGLPVARVPTNRPVKRLRRPDRIFASIDDKWQALIRHIELLHRAGRPVLVGTRSVAASEQVSQRLTEAELAHQVLNAKFDREEAEIIARAGEAGRITIATNMAGRGTDIKLDPEVAGRQGLHVILTERHEAGRIDRQLEGRCGRQGDPGSCEAFLSLEDPLMEGGRAGLAGWLARRAMGLGARIWIPIAQFALRRAQKKMERVHARMRQDLLKYDEKQGTMLSFSGRSE